MALPKAIRASELELAESAAVACLNSAYCLRMDLGMAWHVAKETGPDKIREFHISAGKQLEQAIDIYAANCPYAPTDVIESIRVANARANNLPGYQIGNERYATAHEAGFGSLHQVISAALNGIVNELASHSSCDDLIKDGLGPFEVLGNGKRLRKAISDLSGDLRELWRTATMTMDSVPLIDLTVDIQRERAFLEGFLSHELLCGNVEPRKAAISDVLDEKLVASLLQQGILDALNGRAMKKQQLADAICGGEGTRLYRKGGIKELMEAGLVARKSGVGYFRPDAPPDGLIVDVN